MRAGFASSRQQAGRQHSLAPSTAIELEPAQRPGQCRCQGPPDLQQAQHLAQPAPRISPAIATAALFLYLCLIGLTFLPSVHYYFDAIGIRDAGTVWRSLTWSIADKRYFLPAAVLWHIEGPLQFLFLNAYYSFIGSLFPLKPLTTQIPNAIFVLLCGVMAYRLGRNLESERFGWLCALSFVLMPWLATVLRLPWVFNTMSCLLQLATLSAYSDMLIDLPRRRGRPAAPLLLALYLCTGLDWPSFLLAFGCFLALSRGWRDALRNRWNVLPLGVLAIYAMWTLAVWWYGKNDPLRSDLYTYTMLLYPFSKLQIGATPSVASIVTFGWKALGLAVPLAVAGAGCALTEWRMRRPAEDRRVLVRRACLLAMAVWAFGCLPPLLIHAGSVTYAYVVTVPIALLAAKAMTRLPSAVVVMMAVAMVTMQVWVGPVRAHAGMKVKGNDRRVLAAAAFLVEHRPDLLEEAKTALLPRSEASNVGQYARGRNARLIMPIEFPIEKTLHATGSDERLLRDLVNAYETRGELHADWLILSSEAISPARTKASAFYQRLMSDPRISWIACFQDEQDRKLWLGEVVRDQACPHSVQADQAPVYAVDPLADRYERHYDRISFLSRNVRYIDHY